GRGVHQRDDPPPTDDFDRGVVILCVSGPRDSITRPKTRQPLLRDADRLIGIIRPKRQRELVAVIRTSSTVQLGRDWDVEMTGVYYTEQRFPCPDPIGHRRPLR